MATQRGGPDIKPVLVTQIVPERESALCQDHDGTNQYEVPLMPQRAKGGLPQEGERWIIDRSMGRWQFAYIIKSQGGYNSPFEVVTELPDAEDGRRGQVVFVKGGDGEADTLQICLKSAADAYSWKVLQTG